MATILVIGDDDLIGEITFQLLRAFLPKDKLILEKNEKEA